MLSKEQNNQGSLLAGPNGFLNSSKLLYLVYFLERLGSF